MRNEDRYRLSVRAASAVTYRPILVSHLSAAALHGLPLIGSWPQTVHIIDRQAAGGSSSKSFTVHRGGRFGVRGWRARCDSR